MFYVCAHRYHTKKDEMKGANIVMVAEEGFRDIQVVHIGPLEPEYGFSAVRSALCMTQSSLLLCFLRVSVFSSPWAFV